MRKLLFAAALLFLTAGSTQAKHADPEIRHATVFAQISGHNVFLSWGASTGVGCSATATPPCTIGYNIFRGTAAGAESAVPLNPVPVTTLTYTDPITLTSSAVTYFYFVEAVEIVNGVTGLASAPSNEATAAFPGQASTPGTLSATPK